MPEIGIADKETLDKIDTNVGAKTDAASATGSLHAKIVEMRAYLGGEVLKVQRPRSLKKIDWNVGSTELTNVLYVTGKGELLALAHMNQNQTGDRGLYRIVLDGIEIFNGSTGEGGTPISHGGSSYPDYGRAFSPDLVITTRYSNYFVSWGELRAIGGLNLPFSSSLLIQCAKGGTNSARGVALYSLE